MDQDARHGGGGTAYSLLRHQTLSTALSLPHHTIFLGDCADPRSDGLDNETSSSFDSHNNSNNNYYFSKPIMVLDLIWNLAFVAVSVAVLFSASKEKPSTPLRIWVSGYSLQCLLHVAFVYFQHQNRRRIDRDDGDGGRVRIEVPPSSQTHSSVMKRLDAISTMISSIWWVIGFYWILVGGQTLLQDSPRLYWRGASEEDIRSLPKYRYCQENQLRALDNDRKGELLEERAGSSKTSAANELALLPEDSQIK
ncbi:hypothetical protein MANES_08G066900v8 [Manihot esculenta]|uniref:Uncharacterized protein n=1 Tax=Manihot esculenta TaxID=3983 RepID=A0ACB7H912_MANES|nr:hypothetical protein MANES_08G066900v8 [Manihot esculenta]